MINICIIHYNTPELTDCLVKSINKFTPNSNIYIFDNSDKHPFTKKYNNLTVIDNTKGQIINFDEWLKTYPNKDTGSFKTNNYASAKHCISVEKCFDIINDNFILLDSDILLKCDISPIVDDNCIFVGEVQHLFNTAKQKYWEYRILPFLMYINVKKCKEEGIHFFNSKQMCGLNKNDAHDTASSFYLAAKKYQHKIISINKYMTHFQQGSWNKGEDTTTRWITKNKEYWEEKPMTIDDVKNQLIAYGKQRGLNLNLSNPTTIQDKINWLKIYDCSPLKTKCADKILVHEYCKEKLGKDICIPIIKTYDAASEIKWDELPDKFVIKCNHGSAMNIIVKDKSTIDYETTAAQLDKWLKIDFSKSAGNELHYKDIKRKILVEEYKSDSNQQKSLIDYKFWCFNGEPKMYTVNDGLGHGAIMYYDMQHNPVNLYGIDENVSYSIPNKYELMVEYAKKLSADFKFVCVDFYEIDNEVYLGEMTFTPGSGMFKYKNHADEIQIGSMLDLHKNEKIIVTMTSWKKRIDNVPSIISDMLKQTRKPDIININLSSTEFPAKEAELPKKLVDIVNSNNQVHINWVSGPNRRQWKKIIPAFEKYPNDIIVCVDDDRKYPTNFIDTLYKEFTKHPGHPVTVNSTCKVCGMLQHCGHGTMEKLSYYGDILSVMNEEIYSLESSDTFFTYMANRAGHSIVAVNKELNRSIKLFNEILPLHKSKGTYSSQDHVKTIKYLDKKFNTALSTSTSNNISAVSYSPLNSTVKIESSWSPINTAARVSRAGQSNTNTAPKKYTPAPKRLFY